MANVVDALTVTLGLDAKAFKAGIDQAKTDQKALRDESAKTATELEARGKQAAQFFSSVKNEALGLMGVLLGGKGLESFARNATTELAALGREARNIGIAVPELAAFRNMVERNGGSAEAATSSFRNLTDEMERFKVFGTSSLIPYLSPIGGERGDSAMQTYMKFVKFAQDHKDDVSLINLIGKGLGFDQGSIDTAKSGIAEVNRQLAESYKLGVPTEEMVKRMQEMQSALIGLGQAGKGAGNIMLAQIAPGLTAVAKGLSDIVANDPKALVAMAAITGYLVTIAGLNFGAVTAFLARLFPTVALPLALSGDTAQNPEARIPYDPVTNPNLFDRNGAVGQWWSRTMPSWMGGASSGASSSATPSLLNLQEQQRIAGIRDSLMNDLGISKEAAAGIMSNLWAESGVRGINEKNPTVPGSRGGFGWAQWTGPRRDAFEAWSKAKGLDPASDEANYGFLVQELKTKYPRILQQLQAGKITPYEAANVFYQYESGGDPGLEKNRAGHVVNADQIAGFTPPAGSRFAPATAGAAAPSSVTIGSVVVNTSSGDGRGIARDIRGALADELTTQANRGLQ